MQHLTDNELMSIFQKGTEEAYSILYNRHSQDVYRYVYLYLHDKESSQDIVQETFIRVFRNRHQFSEERASFRTWLHRIAHHLCIDHYRKISRVTFVELDPEKSYSSSPLSDPTAKTVENQIYVQSFLKRLSDEERSVLILAYYQGLQGKEIAEILNIPLGTVKSKLHYSLQKIKKWLKEEQQHVKVSFRPNSVN